MPSPRSEKNTRERARQIQRLLAASTDENPLPNTDRITAEHKRLASLLEPEYSVCKDGEPEYLAEWVNPDKAKSITSMLSSFLKTATEIVARVEKGGKTPEHEEEVEEEFETIETLEPGPVNPLPTNNQALGTIPRDTTRRVTFNASSLGQQVPPPTFTTRPMIQPGVPIGIPVQNTMNDLHNRYATRHLRQSFPQPGQNMGDSAYQEYQVEDYAQNPSAFDVFNTDFPPTHAPPPQGHQAFSVSGTDSALPRYPEPAPDYGSAFTQLAPARSGIINGAQSAFDELDQEMDLAGDYASTDNNIHGGVEQSSDTHDGGANAASLLTPENLQAFWRAREERRERRARERYF